MKILKKKFIKLLNKERPKFEKEFSKVEYVMDFMEWDYTKNAYVVNPLTNTLQHSVIESHCEELTKYLHVWTTCAKANKIPKGYYLMPIQPTEEMIDAAEKELENCERERDSIQDTIIFVYQSMIQIMNKK